MGIRASFTGAQTIDISSIADDMLADVIADHAAGRFRTANAANKSVAGADITYTVTVNGQTVGGGRGELVFPERQIATVVRRTPGRRHGVMVDWLWANLQPATLLRAIEAYGTLDSLGKFVAVLLNPRDELFRFVLTSYLRYRFPAAMARFSQAKDLYRLYRAARFAGNLLPGSMVNPDAVVLAWIARELRERSPVMSGAYRDAHALYGDGRMLMEAGAVTADSDVPEAKEYSFSNPLPYSRKIEFGKTQSGRDFVVSVPNHIYERVAEDARREFRGLANISYEVRAVIDGVQTPQRIAKRQHNRPANRYPSIVVTF